MKNVKNVAKALVATTLLIAGLSACTADGADVASENLSKAADNFEIQRRIVFYNGITDTYILEVTGLCSVNGDTKLSVTCKVGESQYVKHFLQSSDNVTWFAEQLETADVSVDHYRVTFKPESILPDVDLRGSVDGK